MKFVSTRGRAPAVSFERALLDGLAPDGGLYVPARVDPLPAPALAALAGASLVDVAVTVAGPLVGDEIPTARLRALLADALSFPIPLQPIGDELWALELFHGPTFAFKDVGARVMARLMAELHAGPEPLTVLVATSGDTGSAVAQAFHGVAGTRVVVLFPEGRVTAVQEAQFTTLGGNVTAVAVDGAFDDCQRLVKQAFGDPDLRARARLTSANSINIGRLVPQAFYYVHAASTLVAGAPTFSVPSGNFGNLTAGLLAWKLGASLGGLVAATTINDTLPRFLATGRYEPRASIATLANAMDVGDPSNVERMRWLFDDDLEAMRGTVSTSVHTDADVRDAISELWSRYGYLSDPHSAIGYLGTKRIASGQKVFLATAHPAKFREVVEPIVGHPIPLPPALAEALAKPRQIERIPPALSALTPLL